MYTPPICQPTKPCPSTFDRLKSQLIGAMRTSCARKGWLAAFERPKQNPLKLGPSPASTRRQTRQFCHRRRRRMTNRTYGGVGTLRLIAWSLLFGCL